MEQIHDYCILRSIGRGAFSVVYQAMHGPTQTCVAIKIIPFHDMFEEDRIGTSKEIYTLFQLDHPNIVTIFDYFIENEKIYIITEKVGQVSLLDRINDRKKLTENDARNILIDLLSALSYLHEGKLISHRDIKPQNILIDNEGSAVLIDFGFCTSFEDGMMHTFAGTPGFTAPEIVKGEPYDQSCDIWSLGVCLYAMVVGKVPFDLQNSDYDHLIEQIENFEVPEDLSMGLRVLIKQMLEADPMKRIKLKDITINSWIWEANTSNERFKYNLIPLDLSKCTRPDALNNIRQKPLLMPNRQIIKAMIDCGIDTKGLRAELKTGMLTPKTATFNILAKTLCLDKEGKISEETRNITSQMNKRSIISTNIMNKPLHSRAGARIQERPVVKDKRTKKIFVHKNVPPGQIAKANCRYIRPQIFMPR